MLNAITTIAEPAPTDSPRNDPRIMFIGRDEDGVPLEVMAVRTSEVLVIIHAMTLRPKYRPYLSAGQDG